VIPTSRKPQRWGWPGRAIREALPLLVASAAATPFRAAGCRRARSRPLAAWQAIATPPDEARQLAGPLIDVRHAARLAGPRPRRADLTRSGGAHTRELQDLLADALGRGGTRAGCPGRARQAAPTAGASARSRPTPMSRRSRDRRRDREVVQPLADKLAICSTSRHRRRAQRRCAAGKLGDDRVTPARIAAAALRLRRPRSRRAAAFAAAASAREAAQAAGDRRALATGAGDDSWRRRIGRRRRAGGVGPAGSRCSSVRAATAHAVVRAAAVDALSQEA
jgi:hypothetical protein